MKRLDLIRAALKELNPPTQRSTAFQDTRSHVHFSRTVLMELADCLYYLCFPDVVDPSTHVTPPYVQLSNLAEWMLGHVTDIMIAQINYAFILHGDVHAVEKIDEFKPLETSQRAPLNWNASRESELSITSFNGDNVHGSGGGNSNSAYATVGPAPPFASQSGAKGSANGNEGGEATGPSPAYALFLTRCRAKAEAITAKLLVERLPHVRWLLHTDVEAIFKNDVAATSPSEVVFCYPGIRCMLHQRVAHQLYLLGVPTNFTRMLTEIAHSLTGIDIHPRTSIGHHFFIDHGTGIVIGATARIGNHVSLYQGVTLGAKSFPTDKKTGERILNLPRHPVLEDGVTIYANSVVLGRVTIGQGSTIGGNCWIVRHVPPFSSIVQKANRVLKPNEQMFLQNNGSGI